MGFTYTIVLQIQFIGVGAIMFKVSGVGVRIGVGMLKCLSQDRL